MSLISHLSVDPSRRLLEWERYGGLRRRPPEPEVGQILEDGLEPPGPAEPARAALEAVEVAEDLAEKLLGVDVGLREWMGKKMLNL